MAQGHLQSLRFIASQRWGWTPRIPRDIMPSEGSGLRGPVSTFLGPQWAGDWQTCCFVLLGNKTDLDSKPTSAAH